MVMGAETEEEMIKKSKRAELIVSEELIRVWRIVYILYFLQL